MDQTRPATSGQYGRYRPPTQLVSNASVASSQPSISRQPKNSRRDSLPFSFPPLFQPNTSSTSLVPSTAEGKPIPLDDDTAAHRTLALRELNVNYPSRSRYAKSTGAQSSTNSQPVLVRTYSETQSRQSSTTRSIIAGGKPVHSTANNSVGNGPAASVRRIIAFRSPLSGQQHGLLSMARAKSRYSLSNQYEVHVTPHGSGAAFMASVSSRRQQHTNGPTLQAVTSDDERQASRLHKRRGGGARRRSMAMGTLETIMSSSGSSEDGKPKKKSASEITLEVRGRAERKVEITQASASPAEQRPRLESVTCEVSLRRRKSSSFASAMLESTRQYPIIHDVTTPRSSSSTLLSEPALPQTSMNHLQVRTEPEETGPIDSRGSREQSEEHKSRTFHTGDSQTQAQGSLLGGLSGWMPTWSFPPVMGISPASAKGGGSTSHAEGSLRHLLRTTDSKGKGVDGGT
ncbi:hypothetical protein BN1723_008789 [Verticillium longisporum]|uniref:Uncharacterized protein n=1 Tax=Verticillium longisporum TaxID=100787 RepID=A0A0G4KIC9_VERLO|nr:hypothetical protein BN1723_008789 [Verticillium longisporum]